MSVPKLTHSERFDSSGRPRSSGSKSFSQNAMLSSSLIPSSPARRHVASLVSTMNVLVEASNGYACTWNIPCSVSRKMKVKASNAIGVPNHTYFE